MSEISIDTETRCHLTKATPKISVSNFEKETYLPARSHMYITYGGKSSAESKVTLYLDYKSAVALADGILAKLGEMKYRGELKDE